MSLTNEQAYEARVRFANGDNVFDIALKAGARVFIVRKLLRGRAYLKPGAMPSEEVLEQISKRLEQSGYANE
jgi:hypothetical protein